LNDNKPLSPFVNKLNTYQDYNEPLLQATNLP